MIFFCTKLLAQVVSVVYDSVYDLWFPDGIYFMLCLCKEAFKIFWQLLAYVQYKIGNHNELNN